VSIRRHYTELRDFPDGLIAVGDAVCNFNPIYAQGMTVAALSANIIRNHFRRNGASNSVRLMRELKRGASDVAWTLSATSDLAYPSVPGKLSMQSALLYRYINMIAAGGTKDPILARAFVRTLLLVDHPRKLLRPTTMARALRARSRRDSALTPQTVVA
jgi:hypothetical protein